MSEGKLAGEVYDKLLGAVGSGLPALQVGL